MPKRNGAEATTIFLNSIFGSFGAGTLTSIGSMRAFAALLTQRSAANIEIAPKTAAMPIIVTALPRTSKTPVSPFFSYCGHATEHF
jgi:hypothetical protein